MPLLDDPWLPPTDGLGNIPLYRAAAPVAVYRYDGAATLSPLPNLECLSIDMKEGTEPGHARFRYNLASGLAGAPVSIETALGTGFSGPAIVEAGDRLAVMAERPDGGVECLFDGEAVDFDMGLSPSSEEVFIAAVGIAWHCWDTPIGGAVVRDGSDPTKAQDTQTDLIAHFNPAGKPNATPVGYSAGTNSGGHDYTYPVFLDPAIVRDPDYRTTWYVSMGLRHILFLQNPTQQYVLNPDGGDLDALFGTVDDKGNAVGGPPSGPVAIPDLPITGKDWPGTVHRLVNEIGYGMHFLLSTTSSGTPQTALYLFGRQAGPVKSLYLGPRGSTVSPTTFNLGAAGLGRDVSEVVNQWIVQGALTRWEASFVLAPGFPSVSSDAASASSLASFDTNSPAYINSGTRRDAYRLYVLDETGEGHYAPGKAAKLNTVPSLDELFGPGNYAQRRRRPIGDLISVDANNKPYRARLSISTDYTGAAGLWDGTGTWQAVTSTTYKLLSDRLGISITDSNPNSWDVGKSWVSGHPYPGGVVKGIEDQVNSSSAHFWLRLTCVVESDQRLTVVAPPQGGSPLPRPITRVVDASDRLGSTFIYAPSEFLNGLANKSVRSDLAIAQAEAVSMRASTESGVLDGPATIPRLTTYYQIGDRIGSIEGRGLGLQTDSGTGGSTPVYPVVVGVRWDFDGDSQTTTLELSDAGSDRKRYARKNRRVLRDSNGKPRWNRHGG